MGKTYQLNQNKFQEENQLIIALKGLQHEEHWYDGKKKLLLSTKRIC